MSTTIEFGTVAVYEEMGRLLNDDPEWAEKGKDITYSMIYEYGAPVNKAFAVNFEEGKVTDVRELPIDHGEAADFIISGSAETWRGVLEKKINVTSAMTRGQLKVKGKMTTMMKNMSAFGYIIDSMTRIKLV